jgi:hypothetical protein
MGFIVELSTTIAWPSANKTLRHKGVGKVYKTFKMGRKLQLEECISKLV